MSEYYERVAAYFDEDADEWDDRYWTNPIAQRIRQAFREEVKSLPFRNALEVGCGTGLDLVHLERFTRSEAFSASTYHPRWCGSRRCASRAPGSPTRGQPWRAWNGPRTSSEPVPSICGGPGMGDDLEVKVLPEPGRRDRREAQGVRREAYAERSVKRTRESTNRNRIRGAADRGERTTDREAPATKGKRRRSGDCAGKVIVLTRGGLA